MQITTKYDVGDNVFVRGFEATFIILSIMICQGGMAIYNLRDGFDTLSVQEFEIDEESTMQLKFSVK